MSMRAPVDGDQLLICAYSVQFIPYAATLTNLFVKGELIDCIVLFFAELDRQEWC